VPGLAFDIEWHRADGARSPELRATWGRLTIHLDEKPVTRVLDHAARSVRDSIYLPLYPLAEWLAVHWFPLLEEGAVPSRSGCPERHALSRAGEGFAFPDLRIFSEGEYVRIEWKGYNHPFAEVSFLESGEAELPRGQVRQALSSLIEDVICRIRSEPLPYTTALEEEWRSVCQMDEEERGFCRAAGALGLDPFSVDETSAESIIAVNDALPASVCDEFFAAAALENLESQKEWILGAWDKAKDCTAGSEDLAELRAFVQRDWEQLATDEPWKAGYRLARNVRRELGLNGDAIPPGTLRDELGLGFAIRAEQSRTFDALAHMDEDSPQGRFVVAGLREDSQRFDYGRALFEYLTASAFPRLVSRSRTCRQKESRAFSAELLAPARAIGERLAGDTALPEEIGDIAAVFGVSEMVIFHQIQNHGLASLADARWPWSGR